MADSKKDPVINPNEKAEIARQESVREDVAKRDAEAEKAESKPEVTPGAVNETSDTMPLVVPESATADVGKGAKYFKSLHSGLMITKSVAREGQDPEQKVIARFFPYAETFEGDTVRRGYLITDDKEVIDRLKDMPDVEELTKKEYDKMAARATPVGYPMA